MSKVTDLVHVCVVDALRRCVPPCIAIDGASQIGSDLGFDSLAMMELIFCLEDRFAVSIPLAAVAEIDTVEQLVNALKSNMMQCRAPALARAC